MEKKIAYLKAEGHHHHHHHHHGHGCSKTMGQITGVFLLRGHAENTYCPCFQVTFDDATTDYIPLEAIETGTWKIVDDVGRFTVESIKERVMSATSAKEVMEALFLQPSDLQDADRISRLEAENKLLREQLEQYEKNND